MAGSQVVRSTAALAIPTYTSGNFTVSPDTVAAQIRLQLLFSGETPVPGLAPYSLQNGGKTGQPAVQYAGLGATVTVRLVDRFYNLITNGAVMPTVELTTDDPNDENFGFDAKQITLSAGVNSSTITFVTQNNNQSLTTNPARNKIGWQVTATEISALGYTTDVSTWIPTWPNDAVKLRLMASNQLPVEGDDPVASGKTNSGSPVAATVGVAYPLTVQAVDEYWNWNKGLGPAHNSGVGQQINIDPNDPYAVNHPTSPLIIGQRIFSTFEPRLAQAALQVDAVDADGPVDLSSQSITGITVNANTATKYLIVMPGETHAPGSTNGKTGNITNRVAGNAIGAPGVEVILVDAYWNQASTTTQPYVQLSAPEAIDQYAVLPSSQQMVNSQATFLSTVVFRTAGTLNHRLVATDPDSNYTSTTTRFFTVDPNILARWQVLVPGETADPGRPVNWGGGGGLAGKTGSPDSSGAPGVQNFVAGTDYVVTVNGVDNYYNIVSTDATADLTSSDLNGTPDNVTPLSQPLVNGTTSFTFRFLTAQDSTVSPVNPITQTLTAQGSGLIFDTSPNIDIDPNTVSKIQILLPGDTAAPGTALGKVASANNATAGDTYNITVRLTDDYFNAVGNASQNSSLRLATTDPYDSTAPADTDAVIPLGWAITSISIIMNSKQQILQAGLLW